MDSMEASGMAGKNGHFEVNEKTGKMYLKRDTGWTYTPTLNGLASMGLLPTPTTTDWNTPLNAEQKENYLERYKRKDVTPSCTYQLRQMAADGLLPTPRANEANPPLDSENVANRNKSNLEEEIAKSLQSGFLPTPDASMWRDGLMSEATARMAQKHQINLARHIAQQLIGGGKTMKQDNDGQTSRLSPLFTEEMMGFPLMWTALPFLSTNGDKKHSRHTETQ
jgi:hypothetical protein